MCEARLSFMVEFAAVASGMNTGVVTTCRPSETDDPHQLSEEKSV